LPRGLKGDGARAVCAPDTLARDHPHKNSIDRLARRRGLPGEDFADEGRSRQVFGQHTADAVIQRLGPAAVQRIGDFILSLADGDVKSSEIPRNLDGTKADDGPRTGRFGLAGGGFRRRRQNVMAFLVPRGFERDASRGEHRQRHDESRALEE
jgi:hypothetical protein